MDHDLPAASGALNLRERRRRELTRTIALAAVDLFERNGFAATTIEEIAAAAGISRTTFFRHCATKEAAVLVDDSGLEPELIAIATGLSPERALRDLESAWEHMTTVFDSDAAGQDRFYRVWKLMHENPALHAAGLERDARLTARLASELARHDALSTLDAHAIAESFALGRRLSFDEWSRRRRHEPAEHSSLQRVYSEARTSLSHIAESSAG